MVSKVLKGIYKANQCADLNDVLFAIEEVKKYQKIWPHVPALRNRLRSLETKKIKLTK